MHGAKRHAGRWVRTAKRSSDFALRAALSALTVVLTPFNGACATGQKPPLDVAAFDIWPTIHTNETRLSDDGRYASVVVSTPKGGTTLLLQATDRRWKREIGMENGATGRFTVDGQHFVTFGGSSGDVSLLDLEAGAVRYWRAAGACTAPNADNVRYLACVAKGPSKELLILDLKDLREERVADVDGYDFNGSGTVLAIRSREAVDGVAVQSLTWRDLASGTSERVGRAIEVSKVVISDDGCGLAFVGKETVGDRTRTTLRYFRSGSGVSEIVAADDTAELVGMTIDVTEDVSFLGDGGSIMFKAEAYTRREPQHAEELRSADSSAPVLLRSYRDEGKRRPLTMAIAHTYPRGKTVLLRREGDDSELTFSGDGRLAIRRSCGVSTASWGPCDFYLMSTASGASTSITTGLETYSMEFSSTGKYSIWYDVRKRQWYAYDVSRGTIRDVSHGIPGRLDYEGRRRPGPAAPPDVAGWLDGDSAVLVSDGRDLWKLDPEGVGRPVNVTRGVGKAHDIEFMRLSVGREPDEKGLPIGRKEALLLSAFNHTSKENGFFSVELGTGEAPEELTMEPREYYFTFDESAYDNSVSQMRPLKAKNANVYVVKRMSETEFPNLFTTSDFKTFQPLTEFAPQEHYNWYTTELARWKLPDGRRTEGVLFKPEDFDPRKKYPVIVYIYETAADEIHSFTSPDWSVATINPAVYVSNGYLVLMPDLPYRKGYPAQSAYDGVMSAVRFLKRQSFVDTRHLGLEGHSFGGFEVNFILTRTKVFAAASAGAGPTDLIGLAGNPYYFAEGQGGIGATLWNRPDLFVANSPIFSANKVETPLLILHNRTDGVVPFWQAENWFEALSELHQKVWLLSYDGEGHSLEGDSARVDFSIRLRQFFDFYLKGAAPPRWMTSWRRELSSTAEGLELDVGGREP